jgi:uncharacterized protein
MIGNGQIESGIAQSDVVSWTCAGTGVFAADGSIKELRAIASLFPEELQLVVRAPTVRSGRSPISRARISRSASPVREPLPMRVSCSLPRGFSEQDVSAECLRPGVAAARIKDGTLDGLFRIGGVPVPTMRELAPATPVRLIPFAGTGSAGRASRSCGRASGNTASVTAATV